jgi:hypothetical protein
LSPSIELNAVNKYQYVDLGLDLCNIYYSGYWAWY